MRIKISHLDGNLETKIITACRGSTSIETNSEVTLSDVFTGMGIKTDSGLFGIAQRDNGIEIMLDGKILLNIFRNGDDKIEYYSFGNASEIRL